ncbi:MAG: histidine kinase [Verrucomicrobiota bacterium]
MTMFPGMTLRLRNLTLLWLVTSLCAPAAEPSDWGEGLASKFSGDWRKAREGKASLEAELLRLPVIPVKDFGGPGGFRNYRNTGPNHPFYNDHWLQVQWGKSESVDLVCLVPARKYDETGLDPDFELPEDFRVLLVDAQGETLKIIADEHNTRSDPVRKGHPFCYRVDPPLPCSGIRIEATRMYVDAARPEKLCLMAWGEVFCFHGERNVACGAEVSANDSISSHWPWHLKYAVDELTGLGLPEIPDPTHLAIGWISLGSQSQQDPLWVQVDLGSVRSCDGIRTFPPELSPNFLVPGIFYPARFVIEVSDTGEAGSYRTVVSQDTEDFDNVGQHAVTWQWPVIDARYLRFRSLLLRKLANDYPAFLGFSEVQILHESENIALHCDVDVSERGMNIPADNAYFWSKESLTDGYTSQGMILTNRQWMELLHKRYVMEREILRLDLQSTTIARRFRHRVTTAAGFLGGSMLVALVALPILHRRRETRILRALRTRIAADLHDDIGSSMGGIQLLTEAALSKPELAAERLRTIRLLGAGVVASLRDIVWLLRPGSAFQSPVLDHFRETAAILLDDLKWDFESDEASRECRLARETNRHLLLFFREALNNIMRHANCSSIMIRASLRAQIFTLEVHDDGCGISAEQLASPFCLRALRERANHLGGTMRTTTSPDQGTLILLQFPITRSNSAKPS